MKKIALIIGVMALILLSGCSNSAKDLEDAKEAYTILNEAFIFADRYASDTYSAWHYGIYEDDHSKFSLSLEVSLSSSELVSGVCEFLFFDEFSYTVGCVQGSHEDLGNYKRVQDLLDDSKELINKLRDSNSDKSNQLGRELQGYYTAVLNLLNLSRDYSGSFNALQVDIREYRGQINKYKSDLEFDLG